MMFSPSGQSPDWSRGFQLLFYISFQGDSNLCLHSDWAKAPLSLSSLAVHLQARQDVTLG